MGEGPVDNITISLNTVSKIFTSSRDVRDYVVPSNANYFEASHLPSDHMISSRPLIGSPPPQLVDRPPLDFWTVPAWSLKYKELLRIGLVDCPCVEP